MRTRQVFAVGALALALTLTGCGARPISGTPTADPQVFGNAQELVRAATNQTAKAKSAKFAMEIAFGNQAMNGQGEGRFDGENSAMQLSMTVGPVDEVLRYVDKTMYLQVPEQYRAQMTGGKPWGKVPQDSAIAQRMGTAQAQQNDPSKVLQQIQEAGTITRSAHETLDAQPVTHYWIDVDLIKALDTFTDTGLSQDELRKLAGKQLIVPVELWLNQDQLPVRITEDMSPLLKASSEAPAGMQSMKITVKYTDWGVPVDVQAPPADQVGELKLPN
ncbi:LolA-like protein [Amycolatopsis alkalitolerans]|uniref:LppX_LprAFG lipoprotein n=1 Tax=Amycolatopsis alkalitolerans TaxID=2547244 RepID=A0A5C4LXX7_9PSEU|nr:hypothetical protein [Amycolatopsis alkalitolerans]TNC22769.1 hypothetical protein FG385_24325 [Amycolatopsis alkalitolerans]